MRKRKWKLSKAERIQLKAFICVLGVILLVILLVGKMIMSLMGNEEAKTPPVVRELKNVWIMEVSQQGLKVYQDGQEYTYTYGSLTVEDESGKESEIPYTAPYSAREQIADVVLTDECVTEVRVKSEKVHGRVLSAGAEEIVLEGIGRLPVSPDAKGYRLYDSLEMCTTRDLIIGYDFNDFVVENGMICGILIAREEAMEGIRVLLKSADYAGLFHQEVTFSGDTDYRMIFGTYDNPIEELHSAGEVCTITPDSAYFQGDRITIIPSVLTGKVMLSSVNRSQGVPSYRGTIEIIKTEEGLIVVNELPLEEYLYSVVPSEMPASYPGEALKAQAVCARTYAYNHMVQAGFPQYGAHVDDSTSYQVYNNILEQEAATTAVKETYGQLLYTPEGQLAGTYYYSTSCGMGSDATVWKTTAAEAMTYLKPLPLSHTAMEQHLNQNVVGMSGATEEGGTTEEGSTTGVADLELAGQAMTAEETFAAFIKGKSADDFEVTEGWYRWSYEVEKVNRERMLEMLQKRYQANEQQVLTLNENKEFVSRPITELGEIQDICITKRGSGGIAEELQIVTDTQTIKVITEHNIRYVLCDGQTSVLRQDGSEVAMPNLLPSAFFVIQPIKERETVVGYSLIGGGFGHGVGMSQNGAKAMALAGYGAEDILTFFYQGCTLQKVYEDTVTAKERME